MCNRRLQVLQQMLAPRALASTASTTAAEYGSAQSVLVLRNASALDTETTCDLANADGTNWDPATTAELPKWSRQVRERLKKRCPLSTTRNEAGYPLLAVDPPQGRAHPFDPAPPLYSRALGAKMWDIDGNEYTDYNNAFGPHLLGYNHPEVVAAVNDELHNGGLHYNFPYTRDKQSELAAILVRSSPVAVEQICFFNSGSDATAMALRVARAHTGKPKVGLFDGAYHGTHDYGMVQAGGPGSSRTHPIGAPVSDGLPPSVLGATAVLPYNSSAAFDRIREQADELAIVMVQPVQATNPRLGMGPWLRKLADVCKECNVLLAFDEIVTGFRMAWGGGHIYYDVVPDIVCWGKVIGGGMPIGAVGGRQAIMQRFGAAVNGLFPLSPVGHGDQDTQLSSESDIAAHGQAGLHGVFGAIGTFNALPLSLAAGVAALSNLEKRKDTIYTWLEATNARIAKAVNEACTTATPPYPAQVVFGGGAYLQILFQTGAIECSQDVLSTPRESRLATEFKLHLLDQGINVIKTFLLTLQHTEQDIDSLIAAMVTALSRLREDGWI